MNTKKQAILALEDGRIFQGTSIGKDGEAFGEVVFNTAMTGYQEVLTDPSYCGQLVTMTYPHIGNYGLNVADYESAKPALSGFIVRDHCPYPSNWRSEIDLRSFLVEKKIVGIQGIDTRALTKHIREKGAMKGVISTKDLDPDSLIQKAQSSPGLEGRDLVKQVTRDSQFTWEEGFNQEWLPEQFSYQSVAQVSKKRFRVVVYDFGIKNNILRCLASLNCQLVIVPATTAASEVLKLNPHGIFLSNGPGDPAAVEYAIANVKQLIGRKPILGICLGHQILGLAFGGKAYKLKFGHHGANHPVKNLKTGKIEITAQNHGFALDIESMNSDEIELTHINLNDGTLEGMRHNKLPIFSVQYHPEASPGPHDSFYLFKQFIEEMEKQERSGAKIPKTK
ncbi:MAG: carbamoyl phosphate synthase small subunit [Bacteroides sp. SM23_62]|nr:MAG: carbamoyl phosphate synthase small subunit [Bacteroides sp. SM23_62]